MQKSHKRIIIFSGIIIIIVVVIIFSVRYLPLSRFFKVTGTTETEFVNHDSISSFVPHTLYFDFEMDPKSANDGRIYKGIAHTGHYSTKAFGKNSYSFSIERKASEIGLENLGAISISAWVYVFPGKNDPLGNFVFAGSNGSINICWKAVTVSGHDIPRGKWFKISGMFDLSDVSFKPDSKLVFYFWNNSSTDILLDDFYIVFGSPKPRRGDSTLVDLSHGAPFIQKFNTPPYPFHFFGKEEINNANSSFLINKDKIRAGDISPFDRIFSGHFISGSMETEDLLAINKRGKTELFTFCKENNEFRKIDLLISSNLQDYFKSSEIIHGYFSDGGSMQLLLYGPNGLLVGAFEKVRNGCSANSQTTFNCLLKTKNNPFLSGASHLITCDLEGTRMTEILTVAADGSWKVFKLNIGKKEPFSLMAWGDGNTVKQWSSTQGEVKITAGRFLQKYQQDLLLTVSGNKKSGYSWSLLRFNPATLSFISCLKDKQSLGKTIGRDTLKPSDEFLTGQFEKNGRVKVFRYNRDWRYDLKEIGFNDSTFQVIANMDFTGYEKDFNPKYFEILRLFSSSLITPGKTSLLVIGKNHQKETTKGHESQKFIELPDLPDAIQVYTFKNTQK